MNKVEQKDFCNKHDGRHISLQLKVKNSLLNIHNFYVPAGGDEPDPKINEKFKHKLDFLDEATNYIKTQHKYPYTVLVGDLNIAPHENDVWSHKQLLKIVSHTPIEVLPGNACYDGSVSVVRHGGVSFMASHQKRRALLVRAVLRGYRALELEARSTAS